MSRELVLPAPSHQELDLEGLRSFFEALDAAPAPPPLPGVSALVVTPLGWPIRQRLIAELARQGVRPVLRVALPAWPRTASALYVRDREVDTLVRAARYEHVWARLFPGGKAEAWLLPDAASLARAAHDKRRRREALALGNLSVVLGAAQDARAACLPRAGTR